MRKDPPRSQILGPNAALELIRARHDIYAHKFIEESEKSKQETVAKGMADHQTRPEQWEELFEKPEVNKEAAETIEEINPTLVDSKTLMGSLSITHPLQPTFRSQPPCLKR